jgi:subtilase family serine protease
MELSILREESSIPDLVPLPTPGSIPPEGFCRRNTQGQLLVHVFNQGMDEADASKTIVDFAGVDPASFDTPVVAGETSTELVIDIPIACFDINNNCSFTIGVDSENTVAEAEETNNNAAGLCGPQFQ